MDATEGTAAAQPSDHVREFIEQLRHPQTTILTNTRHNESDVWSSTSWGHAGRDAILAEIKRAGELEMALRGVIDHWREFGSMMIENKDDYGFDERLELIAKMVGR